MKVTHGNQISSELLTRYQCHSDILYENLFYEIIKYHIVWRASNILLGQKLNQMPAGVKKNNINKEYENMRQRCENFTKR